MSISLKLPPPSIQGHRISLEFTPQGAYLKISEDMLWKFVTTVNAEYDAYNQQMAEENPDEWFRDHMVGENLGEGLYVCKVDTSFWNYAIEKNGGELVLDSSDNRWDPQLGESYHPACIFNINGGDDDDMGGLWKLPKFTPAHPVLRKGQIELDKAVVDISKCIKLEPHCWLPEEGWRPPICMSLCTGTMRVTIPASVPPGDRFAVKLKGNRHEFTCPQGAGPGRTVHVRGVVGGKNVVTENKNLVFEFEQFMNK